MARRTLRCDTIDLASQEGQRPHSVPASAAAQVPTRSIAMPFRNPHDCSPLGCLSHRLGRGGKKDPSSPLAWKRTEPSVGSMRSEQDEGRHSDSHDFDRRSRPGRRTMLLDSGTAKGDPPSSSSPEGRKPEERKRPAHRDHLCSTPLLSSTPLLDTPAIDQENTKGAISIVEGIRRSKQHHHQHKLQPPLLSRPTSSSNTCRLANHSNSS